MGRSRLERHQEGEGDSDSGSDSSRSRSRSGSAASAKSGGSPAGSPRSNTGSPRSGGGSPKSGIGSPKSGGGSPRSGGGSPKSGGGSPKSGGGSPRTGLVAGSPSPARSGSGSPAPAPRSRSGSVSPGQGDRSKSRSKSRSVSAGSKSPSRSRSRSPGSDAEPRERKGVSDSDSDTEQQRGSGEKRKHSPRGSGAEESGSDGERRRKVPSNGSPATGQSPSEPPAEAEKANEGDIFGDDLSISSEDEEDTKAKKAVIQDSGDDEVARYDDGEPTGKKLTIDSDSDGERQQAGGIQANFRAASKSPVPDVPETRIDVEVPKIQTDLGKEIHFVKLPNFLSVDSRPFDGETYEDEMDEESNQQDEEGRTRLKLKVENTIRWRQGFDKDGHSMKESNARIVKWSDGSYSLHLGNEIFDVHRQPLQSDFNHLFIRQGTGLQGQAVFRTKLSFRPHSTDSQTHKKMTLSMADRSSKTNQIKVISLVGQDPEANRWQKAKQAESALRESLRNESKSKQVRQKGAMGKSYLEGGGGDSDDEGAAFSIAAIKAKYGKGGTAVPKAGGGGSGSGIRAGPGKPVYSSGSDSDSSQDSRRSKASPKGKGKASSGSDSDSGRSKKSSSRSRSSSRSKSGSPAAKKGSPKKGSGKSSGSGSD